jgi:hypothetical protein
MLKLQDTKLRGFKDSKAGQVRVDFEVKKHECTPAGETAKEELCPQFLNSRTHWAAHSHSSDVTIWLDKTSGYDISIQITECRGPFVVCKVQNILSQPWTETLQRLAAKAYHYPNRKWHMKITW